MHENKLKSVAQIVKSKSEKSKSTRHRKKSYYNSIRKQMEFYFGDANLSKDRYLMQLIKDDPYVPLDVFMNFNKMKKLVTSIDDIRKSLTNSQLLELNVSATCVRRRTKIPKNRNADDRTIYVESIPQNADHDWIIKAFSRYGPVSYVSLPKYRYSKKIKEFGFVEFESVDSIEKALSAFRVFSGVLCPESTKPDELKSVTSYIKEQEKLKECDEKKSSAQTNSESDENDEPEIVSDSDDSYISPPPSKRIKFSDTDTQTSELEMEKPPKKKRKHRKKSAASIAAANSRNKESIPDISKLKILEKREWKRLRNKYLNLQREKIAAIKRQIWSNRGPKSLRMKPRLPIHQSPQNMNFYQDRDKDTNENNKSMNQISSMESSLTVPMQRNPLFHYESGLIVHIHSIESFVDLKNFKAEMRQYGQVKYVDIKEGSMDAYLRCDCATNAQKLLRQISCAEYKCEILTDVREEMYWRKIMQDRDEKLNKTIRIRSKRGREKIKQQTAQHLHFDDDD